MKAHFSFSHDFKKQYHSRDKKTRNEIDRCLADVDGLIAYARKKEIPLKKAKLSLPIRTSGESLSFVIFLVPTLKAIVRRLE